ncbi:S-adenosyl-L-methionine-dependent methyltransferase [Auriculariales sp. MPI-PUGE-AT-0066]|nr:S-adenosyl-L-methionine-dependent methyltransferase [Auriculariales sp. MPI-PUGE-AT-0066]
MFENVLNGNPESSQPTSKVKEQFGRLYQDTNELYELPADAMEHGRLGLQGTALFLALEGNYPAREAVRTSLARRADRRCQIIDIGTGPGQWAESMGREFPHADVIGFDLVLPQTEIASPVNCTFLQGDINDGLPQYHGQFDVVHARSILPGVRDVSWFVDELARLLRPGGVMIMGDGDLQLYDDATSNSEPEGTSAPASPVAEPGPDGENATQDKHHLFITSARHGSRRSFRSPNTNTPLGEHVPRALSRDSCAMQRLFMTTWDALAEMGANYGALSLLGGIVERNEAFTEADSLTVFIPMGLWHRAAVDARTVVMSSVMGRDAVMVFAAMKKLLSRMVSEEEVEKLIKDAVDEGNSVTFRAHSAWHYLWAVRTSTPAPASSAPSTTAPVIIPVQH